MGCFRAVHFFLLRYRLLHRISYLAGMDKQLNPSRLIRFEETLDVLVDHLGRAEILNTGYDLIIDLGRTHDWDEMTIKYMLDRYHQRVIDHITAESTMRMETLAALNRKV